MWRFVLDYWVLLLPVGITAHLVWILARGYTTKKSGGVEAVRSDNPALYWFSVTVTALGAAWFWFLWFWFFQPR